VGDALLRVELLTSAGPAKAGPADQLLGYRSSALKAPRADDRRSPSPLTGAIVLRATFELWPGSRSRLLEQIRRDAELRRSKHPLEYASCGSYFKNPSAVRPAARLIDEAGLKGLRIGRAEVSRRHANFLVALDGATAADILALAAEVRRRVLDHSGIQLTEEVVRLGFN
jgi:UDP-N-acetylmuramate dehydrogenase